MIARIEIKPVRISGGREAYLGSLILASGFGGMGTLGECGRVQELDSADIRTGLFGHGAQVQTVFSGFVRLRRGATSGRVTGRNAVCQFSSIMELY